MRDDMKDPVCDMDVSPGKAAGGSAEHAGTTHWFCSPGCREKFVAEPKRYAPATRAPSRSPHTAGNDRIFTCPMHPEVRQTGPGSCRSAGWRWSR